MPYDVDEAEGERPDALTPEDHSGDPIYTPAPGELQLTVRAVVAGCFLGTLVSAMNIYFGLKTGWGIGGSLIAAILAYAFFAAIKPKRPFTPLETNIAQTAGSAAGSMTSTAGLVACIPALMLIHKEGGDAPELGYLELTLWAASVAWIGVFFAVPLRRQMILVEKLRFPTGTATAHTIVAMFGSGAETVRKARALIGWGIVAAAFTLLAFFIPQVEAPPFETWFPDVAFIVVPAGYTFTLLVSPLLWGAGILVGMRVSVSLVAGAIVAWAVLAPLVEYWGWVDGATMSYATGARGWILWPGVAIMVADAMMSLLLNGKSIVRSFRLGAPGSDGANGNDPEGIPNSWWMGGLAIASVLTMITVQAVFGIDWTLTLLAIALSSILAVIATRSTGETDINPISGVGKVTQLVYGGVAPGQAGTNLLAAGITGAGASQAADMMQDLKTGHMLGASPRKQLVAQLVGIVAGVLICVPIFLLVTNAYEIGSDKLPAPSAFAWKAMADVLAIGFHAMPTNAVYAALCGLLFGAAIPLVRRLAPRTRAYLPSGLAFGIAFIIPAFYSFCFLIGAILYAIWKRRSPASATALGFAVASGLIAGEGLMGVVTAALKLLGVEPLTPM
jgi:putative OPT family oligopeptide transporter